MKYRYVSYVVKFTLNFSGESMAKGKRLNLAQKAEKARQRKERRAHIKQRTERREFSLRNILAGIDGEAVPGGGIRDGSAISGLKGGGKGAPVPLRVLIIGDGDFSFSCSFVKSLRQAFRCKSGEQKGVKRKYWGGADMLALPAAAYVVATSYDSRNQVLVKYPESSFYNLRLLGSTGKSYEGRKKKRRKKKRKFDSSRIGHNYANDDSDDGAASSSSKTDISLAHTSDWKVAQSVRAMCVHGVDATDIAANLCAHAPQLIKELYQPCRAFDRVIWNFPHTGEQRVHLNRNLIRDFLGKVPGILADGGHLYITLNWKPPYSLWNLNAMLPKELQARGYLKFSPDMWPGYEHKTTLGKAGGARSVEEGIDGARSYVFTLADGTHGGTALHAAMDTAKEALCVAQSEASTLAAGLVGRLAGGAETEASNTGSGIDSASVNGVRAFLDSGGYDAGLTAGDNVHGGGANTASVLCWDKVNEVTSGSIVGEADSDPFLLGGGGWS